MKCALSTEVHAINTHIAFVHAACISLHRMWTLMLYIGMCTREAWWSLLGLYLNLPLLISLYFPNKLVLLAVCIFLKFFPFLWGKAMNPKSLARIKTVFSFLQRPIPHSSLSSWLPGKSGGRDGRDHLPHWTEQVDFGCNLMAASWGCQDMNVCAVAGFIANFHQS